MKAENIIDSNLRRKSTIANDFFGKNWIFKNFHLHVVKEKKF